MIGILILLAVTLGITILLESIPALLTAQKLQWWKASLVCNVVTNPVLNVLVLLIGAIFAVDDIRTPIFLVLEVAVVFFEAWIYRRMLGRPYWVCLLVSFGANLLSFGIGLAFQGIFTFDYVPNLPIGPMELY